MPTKTGKLSWKEYVIYTDDREPLVKRHEWVAFLTNALYIVRTYPFTAYLYNLYRREYCPIVRYTERYDAAHCWTPEHDNDAILTHDIVLNTTFAAYYLPTLEAAKQAAEEHFANA